MQIGFLSQTVILYNVYKFDPNAHVRLWSVLRLISTSPYAPRILTTKSLHHILPNLHRTTAWAKLDDHQHGPLPPLSLSLPTSGLRLQAVNRPRHQKFICCSDVCLSMHTICSTSKYGRTLHATTNSDIAECALPAGPNGIPVSLSGAPCG